MQAFLNYVKSIDLSMYTILNALENIEFIKTVEFYSNLTFLTDDCRYGMIMNDVKNTMIDIKLILTNGEINAYKPILSIIPYFKGLFEDCQGEVVYIDASIEAMKIIIDAVYFSFIRLDKDTIFEVMLLLDMFMYHQYLSKNCLFFI